MLLLSPNRVRSKYYERFFSLFLLPFHGYKSQTEYFILLFMWLVVYLIYCPKLCFAFSSAAFFCRIESLSRKAWMVVFKIFHLTMATEDPPPAIHYRDLMAECQQLMTKIASIESDRNEHVLVEENLQPLAGNRRAYRYVSLSLFLFNTGTLLFVYILIKSLSKIKF